MFAHATYSLKQCPTLSSVLRRLCASAIPRENQKRRRNREKKGETFSRRRVLFSARPKLGIIHKGRPGRHVRNVFGFLDPLPPLSAFWPLNPRNLPYYVCFWTNPPSPLCVEVLYVLSLIPPLSLSLQSRWTAARELSKASLPRSSASLMFSV